MSKEITVPCIHAIQNRLMKEENNYKRGEKKFVGFEG